VKKYEISQLALQDLDIIGQEMLGHNLKEKRTKQREEHQKWIAQIHEAIAHFQSQANSHRENLKALALNHNEGECTWEVEYSDILQKD
jgi:hypothetical protein